jgi:hypothetical protein
MENTVIKVLTKEHGAKVIKWWESQVESTRGYAGTMCESEGYETVYYGVINGNFGNYSKQDVDRYNAKIIELPEEEFDMTTNEGRLAYAKKHYPIGTVIKSIYTDTKLKLTSEPRIFLKTTIISESSGRCIDVYHAGVWAKIIELPEEEFDMTTNEGRLAYAKKHYPVGTEIYNHNGNYRKIIGEPTKFGPNSIDVRAINEYGEEVNPYLYNEGEGWVKIIKKGKTVETKVMEKQRLTRVGLKEIHSVACSNWKGILEGYGTRNPLEDYIELTEIEVDNMFKACTKDQLPIVSKYLKQDDGSIDLFTEFNIDGIGFYKDTEYILRIRNIGQYGEKSFLLNNKFDWEIKKDERGETCLIPTKKK